MRLQRIDIEHFRGLDTASVPECGNLNVLIGINNTGKSTVLRAINLFFSSLGMNRVSLELTGRSAASEFPYGDATYGTRLTGVVVLDANDVLRLREIAASTRDTALHGLLTADGVTRLRITVSFSSHLSSIDSLFSCIRSIIGICTDGSEHVILEMPPYPNRSIYDVESRALSAKSDQSLLKGSISAIRFNTTVWTSQGRSTHSDPLALYPSAASLSPDSATKFHDAFHAASGPSDFSARVSKIIDTLNEFVNNSFSRDSAHIGSLGNAQTSIPIMAYSILTVFGAVKCLYIPDHRPPIAESDAQTLLRLRNTRHGEKVFAAISTSAETMLGVNVKVYQEAEDSKAELDIDRVSADMNGAGVREALRILLDTESTSPHILLVEEPELHLHPSYEYAMLSYLESVSATTQVFMSTHSSIFLDSTVVDKIYRVSRDTGSRVQLIHSDPDRIATIRELGGRLGSLLASTMLVIVEGYTDRDILCLFADKMGFPVDTQRVEFVAAGGSHSVRTLLNAYRSTNPDRIRPRYYFLIDRDERSEDEVAELCEASAADMKVYVWSVREVDNFLMEPNAIAMHINTHKQGDTVIGPVWPGHVTELIADCIEALKPYCIIKRAATKVHKPLYPKYGPGILPTDNEQPVDALTVGLDEAAVVMDKRRAKISEAVDDATTRVEAEWHLRSSAMVPGEEVLQYVFHVFGMSYTKGRDDIGIASHMGESDIPQEVRDVIESMRQFADYEHANA